MWKLPCMCEIEEWRKKNDGNNDVKLKENIIFNTKIFSFGQSSIVYIKIVMLSQLISALAHRHRPARHAEINNAAFSSGKMIGLYVRTLACPHLASIHIEMFCPFRCIMWNMPKKIWIASCFYAAYLDYFVQHIRCYDDVYGSLLRSPRSPTW